MLKVMSEGIYEKVHILAMTLLCAIAGESVFLLGPPATAKSLVARRLKLAFKDGKALEYLMSRFSTPPDEIFGQVSISLLKNEDKYKRVVDGFLPTATIVFPAFVPSPLAGAELKCLAGLGDKHNGSQAVLTESNLQLRRNFL